MTIEARVGTCFRALLLGALLGAASLAGAQGHV